MAALAENSRLVLPLAGLPQDAGSGRHHGPVERAGFDSDRLHGFLCKMADEIIPISRYLQRETEADALPRSIALWGMDGDRSRFALPLWRVVHLAGAERGAIVWRNASGDRRPRPYVVVDLAADPARLGLTAFPDDDCDREQGPALHDLAPDGLVINLGTRDERIWCLFVDGGEVGTVPLDTKDREDVLFLAGECAGLLFLRDFADGVEDP